MCTSTPSQLSRSASPSKGEADAWTLLLPVLGTAARPKVYHGGSCVGCLAFLAEDDENETSNEFKQNKTKTDADRVAKTTSYYLPILENEPPQRVNRGIGRVGGAQHLAPKVRP